MDFVQVYFRIYGHFVLIMFYYLSHFSKNLVLGCPTSIKTIKVHRTVHQTHGKFNKILQKIDASDWNGLTNQWYNSLNPTKNIDEHGKN